MKDIQRERKYRFWEENKRKQTWQTSPGQFSVWGPSSRTAGTRRTDPAPRLPSPYNSDVVQLIVIYKIFGMNKFRGESSGFLIH